MSTRKHIVVEDELLGRVEAVRGDVPFSTWASRALERAVRHAESEAKALAAARAIVAGPDKYAASTVETARGAVEQAEWVRRPPVENLPPLRPAREFSGPYDPFKKR